jgi:hypothetical protein
MSFQGDAVVRAFRRIRRGEQVKIPTAPGGRNRGAMIL